MFFPFHHAFLTFRIPKNNAFYIIFFFLSIIATSYVKYNNFLPKNMLYCYILTFFSHN